MSVVMTNLVPFSCVQSLGSDSFPNSTSESIGGVRTGELEVLLDLGGISHNNLVGQGTTSTLKHFLVSGPLQ